MIFGEGMEEGLEWGLGIDIGRFGVWVWGFEGGFDYFEGGVWGGLIDPGFEFGGEDEREWGEDKE